MQPTPSLDGGLAGVENVVHGTCRAISTDGDFRSDSNAGGTQLRHFVYKFRTRGTSGAGGGLVIVGDDSSRPTSEPYDAFVSYACRSAETAFVDWLQVALEARSKRLWIDKSSIEPGSAWRNRITRGIASARSYIFVVSPDSAASAECRRELDEAVSAGKRIIGDFPIGC